MKTKFVLGLGIAAMTFAASSAFAATPLYFLNHNDLPASGAIASWDGATALTSYNGALPANGPSVEVVGGQKWSVNQNRANIGEPWNSGYVGTSAWGQWDGYRVADHPASIALSGGATFVVAAKRTTGGQASDWNSIIDVMYDKLTLGIVNVTKGTNSWDPQEGQIVVKRNGQTLYSTGTIAAGQATILSLVCQADGSFEVWAGGVSMLTGGAYGTMTEWDKNRTEFFDQPDWATQGVAKDNWDGWWASVGLTSWNWDGWWAKTQAERDAAWGYTAPVAAFKGSIDVGRNDPDGWSAFNGSIGDVKIFTSALSNTDRLAEVSGMQTSMGMDTPEPGSLVAMFSGLVGLAGLSIRRRK